MDRNSPGRPPCWTTPSTFSVSPVSFWTVTGSFWLRGCGEMLKLQTFRLRGSLTQLQNGLVGSNINIAIAPSFCVDARPRYLGKTISHPNGPSSGLCKNGQVGSEMNIAIDHLIFLQILGLGPGVKVSKTCIFFPTPHPILLEYFVDPPPTVPKNL